MGAKRILRLIAILMLIAAAVFVAVALSAPQLGQVFYIGSFRVDGHVMRVFYLVYLLAAAGLLIASFFIRKKRD